MAEFFSLGGLDLVAVLWTALTVIAVLVLGLVTLEALFLLAYAIFLTGRYSEASRLRRTK